MAVWQILFCLTVLSFVGRALIPIGYMPDLSGKRDSIFAITLCSMGGSTTVMQVDFSGDPGNTTDESSYGGDICPFGLSVTHKLMPGQDTATPVGAASFFSAAPPAGYQAAPLPPFLGPPLGSRAPPAAPARLQQA